MDRLVRRINAHLVIRDRNGDVSDLIRACKRTRKQFRANRVVHVGNRIGRVIGSTVLIELRIGFIAVHQNAIAVEGDAPVPVQCNRGAGKILRKERLVRIRCKLRIIARRCLVFIQSKGLARTRVVFENAEIEPEVLSRKNLGPVIRIKVVIKGQRDLAACKR